VLDLPVTAFGERLTIGQDFCALRARPARLSPIPFGCHRLRFVLSQNIFRLTV
jgi:hypothetical protein